VAIAEFHWSYDRLSLIHYVDQIQAVDGFAVVIMMSDGFLMVMEQ